MGYFRDLLIVKTTDNFEEVQSLIDFSEKLYAEFKEQSNKFEAAEIVGIIESLSNYEKTLKNTSQQYLWLEVALINITNRHDIQVINDLESRISKLEEALSGRNIQSKSDFKKPPVENKIADQIKPQPEIPESGEIVSNLALSGNLNHDWAVLLNKLDSLSTKALFSNVKPIEISPEKIIITFSTDMLVKMAQDKQKIALLEKAAENILGTIPQIIIRTPLPEDDSIRAVASPIASPVLNQDKKIELPKEEKFEQISQDFEEISAKKSDIEITEAPLDPIESEVIDQIKNLDKNASRVNLSDQAKTILNLFQGKIIE